MTLHAWTDSHCHLHDLEAISEVLERSRVADVRKIVCVGTTEDSSRAAMQFAREMSLTANAQDERIDVWATAGQHPHDADRGSAWLVNMLASSDQITTSRMKSPGEVVAVGECGLDYYYNYSDVEHQRVSFIEQMRLAKQYDLALVVHTREAWEDTFSILEREARPDRVIIHCFTGGPEEARRCLDLGAHLSFSGISTFKNAEEIRQAFDLCPMDRVLIETDAPYLAPVPYRGKPNEPAHVSIVGTYLATRRGVEVSEFARITSDNACRVFGFAP